MNQGFSFMADERIAAVILAAGRSSRMGRAKMTLPWGRKTVIASVVEVLAQGGVDEIVVVTGGSRLEVEAALIDLPTRPIYNPDYVEDSMILSLQIGLRSLSETAGAALVALGDQPQIQADVVRRVIRAHRELGRLLAVPSFQMRRGHPWLVARPLWDDLLSIRPPETIRAFLDHHADEIRIRKCSDRYDLT